MKDFSQILKQLVASVKTKRAVYFSEAIEAINTASPVDAVWMRKRLKMATGVGIADIRAAEKAAKRAKAMSQAEIAQDYLHNHFTPMGRSDDGREYSRIRLDIASKYADQPRCQRLADYNALTTLVISMIVGAQRRDRKEGGVDR